MVVAVLSGLRPEDEVERELDGDGGRGCGAWCEWVCRSTMLASVHCVCMRVSVRMCLFLPGAARGVDAPAARIRTRVLCDNGDFSSKSASFRYHDILLTLRST